MRQRGLRQPKMAELVPDDSLLCFEPPKIYLSTKTSLISSGKSVAVIDL